jgi:hypothetical protein
MIAMFFDPIQIVGWLLILLLAGVLVWQLISRQPPEAILSELLQGEDSRPVGEDSRAPDEQEIEP